MRILLVKPYNLTDHIQPSLGLGYLATAVRKDNEVRILDCVKENIKINRFGKTVKDYNPDIVGIQCYTFDLKFINEALNIIKSINKNIITILGGPHPSAVPVETMEYFGDKLDFAFRGECEKSLPLFIDYLEKKRSAFPVDIPGIVWRQDGGIKYNDCLFEDNLDSFGMPSWDLIHPETYPESQHGAFYRKFPIATIMLTRGCPYQCTFCAGKTVSGTKLRKRSIANVIEEIKILNTEYGIKEFHIIDDNFTLDKVYATSFLKELKALNLDISLATPNGIRMDTLDDEMLSLMRKNGLYLISLGIESGSDRVLKLMKKNLTVKKIREAVHFIRAHGLDVAGFFILGFPDESKEEVLDTIGLSLDLDLVRANFFTYLPFPGTESYRRLMDNGEIGKVNWDRFYFTSAAYAPENITNHELKRLQRLAFFKFYMRPVILWRNLREIRSIRHFLFLIKRFFHWIIMN
ncbi:MAG: radical SAM protein [Candidatus Omnitrophota bacterium]